MALDRAQLRAPLVTFSSLVSYFSCSFFPSYLCCAQALIICFEIPRSTLMTPFGSVLFCSFFFLDTLYSIARSLSQQPSSLLRYGSPLVFSVVLNQCLCANTNLSVHLSACRFLITSRLYCSRDTLHVPYGNLCFFLVSLALFRVHTSSCDRLGRS